VTEELSREALEQVREYCLRSLGELDNRLSELRKQVVNLEQRRALLARLLEDLSHLYQSASSAELTVSEDESSAAQEPPQPLFNFLVSTSAPPTRSSKSSTSHPILKHVHEILKDHPQGLHYTKVYELLLEKGYKVPGKRPQNNLATYMARDTKLERVGRGVYILKPEPEEDQS